MPEKECECKALDLLLRMTNAYEVYFENVARGERALERIGDEFLAHLQDEYKDPKYDPRREEYNPIMDKLSASVADASVGKTSFLMAVEVLRNTIHDNPAMRQMLTCGPPHTPETETPLTKDVFQGLELLENADPSDVRKVFKEVYAGLTCETSEGAEASTKLQV